MAKKNLKGLSSDTRPSDQPQETYPFGKNGIQDWKKLAQINEPGFTISSAAIPYTMMGCIPTDGKPIIFSTDDTNSCVGFFDPDTDTYVPIFDDTNLDFKIGFKKANYITGEYQKSNKGEYIAVFTDKVLPLRWLNCSNPDITKSEDLLFFLRAKAPTLTVNTESGGQLLTGSYLVFVKYARNDGSETPYLTSSVPVIVSGADGSGTSDKAIRINLTNCDLTYDYVVISVIKKIAGITTAEQLDYITIGTSVDVLYTGTNTTNVITTEEILIPPAIYSRVGTLTQLNGTIFLGNLDRLPAINFQRYASLIQVRFVSQEVDMLDIPESILNGLKKGFAHGEIYALYIRLRMTDGSKSKAFTIAGRAAVSGEEDTITDSGLTAKRYQIHDTVLFPSLVDRSGTPCLWINQDEEYPDTVDFDSSALGGPNLRGQKVRHHKMPTHHWVKNNFNSGDTRYGKNKLDILGLKLSGVVIPPDIIDMVDSYEILYAKRTSGNTTVLGQSAVIYAAQGLGLIQANTQNNFQSTGGNWRSIADISTFRDFNKPSEGPLYLKYDRIRMHPFEMLFNKLEIPQSNCYVQFEWLLASNSDILSYGFDNNIPPGDRRPTDAKPVVYKLDYKTDATSVLTITPDNNFIRKLLKTQYAPNNVNGGEWNSSDLETSVVGQLSQAGPPITASSQRVSVGEKRMKNFDLNDLALFEQCYLGTLRVIRNNLYTSVLSQSLVNTGQTFDPTTGTTLEIYGGDVFPCDYTSHTYGWESVGNGETGLGDQSRAGTKVIRRVICESVSNINQRYEIAGNIYSKWYPNTAISFQNVYIMDFQRQLDPNQFGYSKDLNSLNDFESIAIFNPGVDDITSFPYRVHRGGIFKRQGKPGSWRVLLPLDYYDMPKNRGVIINLCGFDDSLLIHHESALFVTQDKTTLEGDVLKVTLGTADIFQYDPQEAMSSALGYAGTHHDLACVLTPLGYIFVDNRSGEIFIFKSGLKLINQNINNFLREYSKVEANNPYIGNGITIGYDPEYKRLLTTVKNLKLPPSFQDKVVPGYEETQAYFDKLTQNESIVYHAGTWMTFKGLNTTGYDCPGNPNPPTIADADFTTPENSLEGTVVGQLTASDPQSSALTYVIMSGNDGGAFRVDATGKLLVANPILDFETKATYNMVVRVINTFGLYDDANVVVHITNVNEPPTVPDYQISVNENTANGTALVTVVGTDPEGNTLTYSIVGGNDLGTFAINSATGVVTVLDNTTLDYESHPQFVLQVQVTDGTTPVISTVTINVINVNEGPTGTGASITIPGTDGIGTLVLTGTPATDPDGELDTLTYSIHSQTSPGMFNIDLDPDSDTFLQITVATILTGGLHQIVVRVNDSGTPSLFVDLIYNITVTYQVTVTNSAFTILDTTTTASYIGTIVAATQPVGQAGNLVYQLVTDSTPSGTFGLIVNSADPNFLKVKVLDNTKLDPLNNNYVITVKAFNENSPSDFQTFTITVTVLYDSAIITEVGDAYTCIYGPPPVACGSSATYDGGEAFPTIQVVNLGSGTGDVFLNADALSIPDKFEVWFEGVKVIDTGYRGDTSYQSALDTALAARSLPPETITSPGAISMSFHKSTATITAEVRVYAPLDGTSWNFTLNCPV